MYSLVHSQSVDGNGETQARDGTMLETDAVGYFRSIPPERIGLNGEYDHNGLVKRVEQAVWQQFQIAELAHLSITQRGSVVVLAGWVSNQAQLDRLITIALETLGTNYVETHEVRLLDGTQIRASTPGSWFVKPSLPATPSQELERRSA